METEKRFILLPRQDIVRHSNREPSVRLLRPKLRVFDALFHEVDEILLKKQIWRDLAEFAVKNKQTETIERREVFVSYSKSKYFIDKASRCD